MYRSLLMSFFCFSFILNGCNNKQEANIDGIQIDIVKKRFEEDFFKIDTVQLDQSLKQIENKYPLFYQDFRDKILGLQELDSLGKHDVIKKFLRDYRSIFDSSRSLQQGVDASFEKITKALKYVRYYFPEYTLPKEFITFIGPIDAFAYGETGGSGEIITNDALCSGLQLHLGSESSIYKSDLGQQLYPAYISRKFTTNYIASNSIKNIIDDIYPSLPQEKTLLDIVVDHGKRMYLLDLFMPFEDEEIKLGYTKVQLDGVKENEGYIWSFFTENNLLYEKDILKIRSFVTDGPMTSEFGIGSPGFISLFVGKQMIYAYLKAYPKTNVQQLLKLDSKTILAGSKYRPR